jgi:aminoglycoside/choline kinase family phosphotransferase
VLNALTDLYVATFGMPPVSHAFLAGDGSRRRMLRLTGGDGTSLIGVHGPDALENRAFISYAASLRSAGLPVPAVHAVDEEAGVYLVDDLGDVTLHDLLLRARSAGRFPEDVLPAYRQVLTWLPRFQVEGGRAVDYAAAYPRPRYDAQAMQWDCNYFKYDFLKLAHVPFHEGRLEEDFQRLIAWLGEAEGGHFVYRDLQSRNIMWKDAAPWFIDFQGGLQGPLQYDVAKLLYEGKAGLPQATRDALLDHYLEALATHIEVDRDRFLAHFRGFVVLRILQGLGAYGYLGLYGRKPQFVARIPHAIRDIEALLASGFLPLDLPELRRVFETLVADEVLRREPPRANGEHLTVRIASFSYKGGYPPDEGGHGGGYAFDCRGLPNPGRLPEYAGRSGLEPEVVAYLETEPACGPFFDHAHALVTAQIQVYVDRGFDSLQVLFGCTGGQHRSVYMAERLGRVLRAAGLTANVTVDHMETARWPASAARIAPITLPDPVPDAVPLPDPGA